MARQSRWWRPRDLFPRTTALWIQSRRAPHHVRLRIRSFFESPSLWTTSVLAGMLAIVLTLLLFVVGPPPEVALEPAGTPDSSPPDPVPTAQLSLDVHQGALPIWWDEREQLLVQSRPTLAPTPIEFALADSGWMRTRFPVTAATSGVPEDVSGELVLPLTVDPPLLTSSDLPPDSVDLTAGARLGVEVEKVWSSVGDQHNLLEYALIVRNRSSAAVQRFVLREAVPDISQLVDVEPPASLSRQGKLIWELGPLDPDAELQINISYRPAQTGAFETHAVADVQSSIGVVTKVSEPFVPEPVVVTPEPAVTEPAMIEPEAALPEPVLPAGLAFDPLPAQSAELVLPADDEEATQPIAEPLRDVFPFPAGDPEPVLPAAEPSPAVVRPAEPAEAPSADWPPFNENGPPEPRPRPLVESVPRQPLLSVRSRSPEVVARGDVVTTVYEISNDGTAAAENVALTVHLTGELLHRHGDTVKHSINRLEPGEMRQARLLTRARETGTATLDAALTHDGKDADAECSHIRVTAAGAEPTDVGWGTSEASAEPPSRPAAEILR